MQERVARDELYPWRVIVTCCLLNCTTGRQVRPVVEELFERWPTPRAMARSGRRLEELLRPLGLVDRRCLMLRRMSQDYGAGIPAAECSGVGPYVRDALSIFVEGRRSVRPDDGHLARYSRWLKQHGGAGLPTIAQ